MNCIFKAKFNSKIASSDEEYKFWFSLHPTTGRFIGTVSGAISFKMSRLVFSFLYGFENFHARFDSPDVYVKLLRHFTVAHILFVNVVILGVDGYTLFRLGEFSLDSQIKITLLETGALALVMILLSLLEMRRVRRYMLFDYNTMEMDDYSRMAHNEELSEKQLRRDMLKKIMQQCKGNQDLVNEQ